jgi:hypothetical protein
MLPYRRRQPPSARNAPKLPLQRNASDNISDVAPPRRLIEGEEEKVCHVDTAGGTNDSMGMRQDTSFMPLKRGEVRVPRERPPVIFGRWASVTQTGELFPAAEFEGGGGSVIPSPSTMLDGASSIQGNQRRETIQSPVSGEGLVAPSAAEDAMEAMEKHVSNMLLEAEQLDDAPHNHDVTGTESQLTSPSSRTAAGALPPTLAPQKRPLGVVPLLGTKSGAAATHLLKRISDHYPRFLFPPPPPPMPDRECYDAFATHGQGCSIYSPLMRKKMMRWYQIVEAWCIERSNDDGVDEDGDAKDRDEHSQANEDTNMTQTCSSKTGVCGKEVLDSERAIVAPPPRPPMFSEHVAPALEHRRWLVDASRIHAPYTMDQWVDRCRFWWARVMQTFDKLRDDQRYCGMKHVSKAPVARLWSANDVSMMIV